MEEVFFKVKDWDLYLISKSGLVKRCGRFKKPTLSSTGYLVLSLREKKRRQTFSLHRLLAINFIPNPLNLPQVNHKDGNKLNNDLSNLEWVTHKQNMQHAVDIGLNKGRKYVGNKLTIKQANEIRDKYVPHKYSQNKLAKEYGVDQSSISRILSGELW